MIPPFSNKLIFQEIPVSKIDSCLHDELDQLENSLFGDLKNAIITPRLFAHISGDLFVKNTPLDGLNFDTTLQFILQFESFPEKLKNDLKGLAFWQQHLNICRMIPHKFSEMIIQELMSTGRVMLPGGYSRSGGPGHALIYEIDLNQSFIRIYNTGEGINAYHSPQNERGLKYHPSWTWSIDDPKVLLCPFFYTALYAAIIEPSKPSERPFSSSDIYESIMEACPGKLVDSLQTVFITPQHAGTCSWQVLMALIKMNVPEDEYQHLNFLLQFLSLYQMRHTLDSGAIDPSNRELFFKCSQKFARMLCHQKELGFINDAWLSLGIRFVQDIELTKTGSVALMERMEEAYPLVTTFPSLHLKIANKKREEIREGLQGKSLTPSWDKFLMGINFKNLFVYEEDKLVIQKTLVNVLTLSESLSKNGRPGDAVIVIYQTLLRLPDLVDLQNTLSTSWQEIPFLERKTVANQFLRLIVLYNQCQKDKTDPQMSLIVSYFFEVILSLLKESIALECGKENTLDISFNRPFDFIDWELYREFSSISSENFASCVDTCSTSFEHLGKINDLLISMKNRFYNKDSLFKWESDHLIILEFSNKFSEKSDTLKALIDGMIKYFKLMDVSGKDRQWDILYQLAFKSTGELPALVILWKAFLGAELYIDLDAFKCQGEGTPQQTRKEDNSRIELLMNELPVEMPEKDNPDESEGHTFLSVEKSLSIAEENITDIKRGLISLLKVFNMLGLDDGTVDKNSPVYTRGPVLLYPELMAKNAPWILPRFVKLLKKYHTESALQKDGPSYVHAWSLEKTLNRWIEKRNSFKKEPLEFLDNGFSFKELYKICKASEITLLLQGLFLSGKSYRIDAELARIICSFKMMLAENTLSLANNYCFFVRENYFEKAKKWFENRSYEEQQSFLTSLLKDRNPCFVDTEWIMQDDNVWIRSPYSLDLETGHLLENGNLFLKKCLDKEIVSVSKSALKFKGIPCDETFKKQIEKRRFITSKHSSMGSLDFLETDFGDYDVITKLYQDSLYYYLAAKIGDHSIPEEIYESDPFYQNKTLPLPLKSSHFYTWTRLEGEHYIFLGRKNNRELHMSAVNGLYCISCMDKGGLRLVNPLQMDLRNCPKRPYIHTLTRLEELNEMLIFADPIEDRIVYIELPRFQIAFNVLHDGKNAVKLLWEEKPDYQLVISNNLKELEGTRTLLCRKQEGNETKEILIVPKIHTNFKPWDGRKAFAPLGFENQENPNIEFTLNYLERTLPGVGYIKQHKKTLFNGPLPAVVSFILSLEAVRNYEEAILYIREKITTSNGMDISKVFNKPYDYALQPNAYAYFVQWALQLIILESGIGPQTFQKTCILYQTYRHKIDARLRLSPKEEERVFNYVGINDDKKKANDRDTEEFWANHLEAFIKDPSEKEEIIKAIRISFPINPRNRLSCIRNSESNWSSISGWYLLRYIQCLIGYQRDPVNAQNLIYELKIRLSFQSMSTVGSRKSAFEVNESGALIRFILNQPLSGTSVLSLTKEEINHLSIVDLDAPSSNSNFWTEMGQNILRNSWGLIEQRYQAHKLILRLKKERHEFLSLDLEALFALDSHQLAEMAHEIFGNNGEMAVEKAPLVTPSSALIQDAVDPVPVGKRIRDDEEEIVQKKQKKEKNVKGLFERELEQFFDAIEIIEAPSDFEIRVQEILKLPFQRVAKILLSHIAECASKSSKLNFEWSFRDSTSKETLKARLKSKRDHAEEQIKNTKAALIKLLNRPDRDEHVSFTNTNDLVVDFTCHAGRKISGQEMVLGVEDAFKWWIHLPSIPRSSKEKLLVSYLEAIHLQGFVEELAAKALNALENPEFDINEMVGILSTEWNLPLKKNDSRYKAEAYLQYISRICLKGKQSHFAEIIDDAASIVHQQSYGTGKSAVNTPLALLMESSQGQLCVNIVPKGLFKIHLESMKQILSPLGLRAVSFTFNRTDSTAKDVLIKLLKKLQEAQQEKTLLVTTAEDLESFLLKFFEIQLLKSRNEELTVMKKILNIFRLESTAIIDEVHEILKALYEKNYAIGRQTLPSKERREVPLKLYGLMNAYNKTVPIGPKHIQAESSWSLEYYENDILPYLAKKSLEDFYYANKREYEGIAFLYLTKKTHFFSEEERAQTLFWQSSLTLEQKDRFVILRAQLQMYLPHTLSSRHNIKYGLEPHRERVEAIPYSGNMCPSTKSSFSYYDIIINYTIQSYLIDGISNNDIAHLVSLWKKKDYYERSLGSLISGPQANINRWLGSNTALLTSIGEQIPQAIEDLQKHPEVILEYLQDHLLDEIHIQTEKLHAGGPDLVNMFSKTIGMSGSLNNRFYFPTDLKINLDYDSDGFSVKLLNDEQFTSFEEVPEINMDTICRIENLCSVLDPEGHMQGISNKSVAKKMLESLPGNIRGVLFYNMKDECLHILDRKGSKTVYKRESFDPDHYVVYYDQARCTGLDIPIRVGGVGVILLRKEISFTRIAQAANRLRGYGKSQKVHFLLPAKVKEDVIAKTKHSVDLFSITLWSILNEAAEITSSLIPMGKDLVHSVYRKKLLRELLDGKEINIEPYQMLLKSPVDNDLYKKHACIEPKLSSHQELKLMFDEYENAYGSLIGQEEKRDLALISERLDSQIDPFFIDKRDEELDFTAEKEVVAQKEEQLEDYTRGYSQSHWKVPETLNADAFKQIFPSVTVRELTGLRVAPGSLVTSLLENDSLYFSQNFLHRDSKKQDDSRVLDIPTDAEKEERRIFYKYLPRVKHILCISQVAEHPCYLAVSTYEACTIKEAIRDGKVDPGYTLLDLKGNVEEHSYRKKDFNDIHSSLEIKTNEALCLLKFLNNEVYFNSKEELFLRGWLAHDGLVKLQFFSELFYMRKFKGKRPQIRGSTIDTIAKDFGLDHI